MPTSLNTGLKMKFLLQSIFAEYEPKILDDDYFPITPVEALKARIIATGLLAHSSIEIVKKAEDFIRRTTKYQNEELSRLKQLALQVKAWNELQICSSYTNTMGTFLEYKLSITKLDNQKETLHSHIRFALLEQQCLVLSENAPLIRIIGDPILQKPGTLFPQNPSLEEQKNLSAQIEHAKSVLIQTSGAGIAANQCAEIQNPYRFTIVGVFNDIKEHVSGVERRYPGTIFPQAKIMVNPVITAVSKESQNFNHACLSVPCANRCAVNSPMELSVRYNDFLDGMCLKDNIYKGIDAVVLWHELTHIIGGKTYIDVTFESLCIEELLKFKKMLVNETINRQNKYHSHLPTLTVPPFYFSVKIDNGISRLDIKELAKVLPEMSDETLEGLLTQASFVIKKKLLSNQSVSSLSVFAIEEKKENSATSLDFRLSKL